MKSSEVLAIKARHANGETYRELADFFGVSYGLIGKIVRGEIHAAPRRCGRGNWCVAGPWPEFKGNNAYCQECLAEVERRNRRDGR